MSDFLEIKTLGPFLARGWQKLLNAQKKFCIKNVCQNHSIADEISRNLALKLFLRAVKRKKVQNIKMFSTEIHIKWFQWFFISRGRQKMRISLVNGFGKYVFIKIRLYLGSYLKCPYPENIIINIIM